MSPQSGNSVARVELSRRHSSYVQPAAPALHAAYVGSHGIEHSPYGEPVASSAQRPSVQSELLEQYSRQNPSVVHVCSGAQSERVRHGVSARPVPAGTHAVVEPVHSHFWPVGQSVL
jgi:hypothetical protein